MGILRHVLWGVPLLLLLIAVGVVVARGRIAEIGGLDEPYERVVAPPVADPVEQPAAVALVLAPVDAPVVVGEGTLPPHQVD